MKPVPETIIDSYTFEHWFFFKKIQLKPFSLTLQNRDNAQVSCAGLFIGTCTHSCRP